jgi:hypothetical protein
MTRIALHDLDCTVRFHCNKQTYLDMEIGESSSYQKNLAQRKPRERERERERECIICGPRSPFTKSCLGYTYMSIVRFS